MIARDRTLDWRHWRKGVMPYSPHIGRLPDDEIMYKLNRFGYRSPETTPEGSLRVAAYGCGATFGIGKREEDIWPSRLATLLTSSGRETVSLNFGVVDSGPDLQAMLIHQTVEIVVPDLVVVLWGDIRNFAFHGEHFNADLMTPVQKRTDRNYINCQEFMSKENGFFRFIASFHLAYECCAHNNVPMLWGMAVDSSDSLGEYVDCAGLIDHSDDFAQAVFERARLLEQFAS